MKILSLIGAASVLSMSFSAQVLAGPVGEWRIADGSANVSIRPCGSNLCGFVSWSQEGQNVVGKEVLISMHPNGALWSGTVVNVRDGQKYAARMSMQDDETLKVEGCVMGGMICGGQKWARVQH
jgi:uncharacterized protein (DUF2147 family)